MKKDAVNRIVVEGYLKDNTLATATSKDGVEYISGNITVATVDGMEYTLRYYSSKLKKDGTENKNYASLANALPSKTTTCAHLLETGSVRTFEEAKVSSSLVRCTGEMREEFWKGRDGDIHTMIRLRGISVRILAGKESFNPKAEFTLDAYIETLRPEVDKEGDETGRALIEAVVPLYGGSASKMTLVGSPDNGVSDFILSNWTAGNTYLMRGDLVKLRKETIQAAPAVASFGKKEEPRKVVEFIDERVITGGNVDPYDEENTFTREEITEMLVKRDEEMASEMAKEVPAARATGTQFGATDGATRPAPAATKKATAFDDIDF